MQTVTVKDVVFGEGKPKICVPLAASKSILLHSQAVEAGMSGADLCEWRIDWLDEQENLQECARILREHLPDMPLLFTFRTQAEGGERALSDEEYRSMCELLIAMPECDLIDIELFTAGTDAAELVRKAHEAGKTVVFSSHDFSATPPEEEIIGRLKRMEELGGDLLKIAVTPTTPGDVLTLLSATVKMHEQSSRPLITISMGRMGAISRVCGDIFGSCLTFGTTDVASAPGQIPVADLKHMLDIFSRSEYDTGWVRVDAYLIPENEAEAYIADREYYAEKAAEIFREFYPLVFRAWAGSEDGEAVTAYDKDGRLMMHIHLDPSGISGMKEADQKGELRRWLLSDYIKEE